MKLEKFTRHFPTEKEGNIIRRGLSPWSLASECDFCGSAPSYMKAHSIAKDAPLMQVGRWMLHEQCHRQAKTEHLTTLKLPRLDYGVLGALPAPARIGLMKLCLYERTIDVRDALRYDQ
jgi:hypothetical protein